MPENYTSPLSVDLREQFRAEMQKVEGQMSLGLHMDPSDGNFLYIERVRPGDNAAQRYNDSVLTPLTLMNGDYVISVNGQPGKAAQMCERIRAETNVNLEVLRPQVRTVHIKRSNKMLGVECLALDTYNFVLIERMGAGAIKNYNLANPGKEIMVGDRIVAVNGEKGDGNFLMDRMADLDEFNLTLHRCPDMTFRSIV